MALRQPVGSLRVSLRTLACAVGGRGEGAWGPAGAGAGDGEGGRVWEDGHFVVRTTIALPPPL